MIKNSPYRVLGFGAGFIDLLVPVENDFLSAIAGEKGGSQAISVEEMEALLLKTNRSPRISTGGSCANTIKALTSLGEKCGLLSQIGNDALGTHFSLYMNKIGVVGLFKIAPLPMARVLCLITPDGQRTMRFCQHSSQDLSSLELSPLYFHGVDLVHLEGYSLRDSYSAKDRDVLQEVIAYAKKVGAKISMDLSSYELVKEFKNQIKKIILESVDVLFANEDEISALTGLQPYDACRELQHSCPIVVVLRGKNGALIGFQNRLIESPACPANVLDTTGAGDYFAAGFLYGLINHYSIEECARCGNLLGAAIVQVEGTELPDEKWHSLLPSIQPF